MEINVKERSDKAVALFADGYNCSQSVFMAYADLYNMSEEYAATIASSFGGGMGRLREVCGTCTGMFLVASMQMPADNKNKKAKIDNYTMVQELAEEFRKENGSIVCRELLGLDHKKDDPTPEVRTEQYYKKRPCSELVRIAAKIVGNKLMTINS